MTNTSVNLDILTKVATFKEKLTPTAARALLKLQFDSANRKRMAELSARARQGKLSQDEDEEMDAYEQLGSLLDVIHSQARQVLRTRRAS